MNTSVLIIGQGLCGNWLSYYLRQAGVSCIVIDENKKATASKAASGIINPVTGRRHVKTWMIDEVMPFAAAAYRAINDAVIEQKNTLDFFPSQQMQQSFTESMQAGEMNYLKLHEKEWHSLFNYTYGIGEINPCWLVHVQAFLNIQKNELKKLNSLHEENFEIDQLKVSEKEVVYREIHAEKIIFCDGIASGNNPYFKNLPFAFNKGEALIIECADLPQTYIYKNSRSIVPWNNGLFWVGSSFQWDFKNDLPTADFRNETTGWLNNFLKLPFKVMDHLCAVRPANTERRPFVGFHPVHKNAGILNGMGSKGVSLAPYFARQLAEHIVSGKKINPEADVRRLAF